MKALIVLIIIAALTAHIIGGVAAVGINQITIGIERLPK